MKTREFIFTASLFFSALAAGAARAQEPACGDGNLAKSVLGALSSATQAITRKVLLSGDMALLEHRLANLQDPSCRGRIWPEHKFNRTPLRFFDESSVFQFNPDTKKLEFLRPVTAEDRRVERFDFQNPPKGDGGTIMNIAFFRPKPRPRNPNGPRPGRPEKPKGALCYEQNIRLIDFMNANTGEHTSDQTDDALSLAAHESFHNVDQNPSSPVHEHTGASKWHYSDADRTLPGDVNAMQFIRQNATIYLRQAYGAPAGSAERRAALAQVKAWMAKLAHDFPAAAQKLLEVDRGEGSAEYTGMLTNALGKLGCNADPAALKTQLLKEVDDRILPVPAPVDSQSYLLGSLAGFLMDEAGNQRWKVEVTAGRSPMSVLLDSPEMKEIPAEEPRADPLLEKSRTITEELHGCMQAETDRAIGRVIARPQDYVLVQMEKTAFSVNGFFSVSTPEGNAEATPQGSSTTGEKLNFLGAPMVMKDGICGGGQAKYVLVPRSAVDKQGRIETNPAEIPYYKGSIPPPSTSDRSWNKVPVVCRY